MDTPEFVPVELAADAAFVALGADAAFEAPPYEVVYLVVEADVEGAPVRFGLALDGATTAPPDDAFAVVATPGAPAHSLVHLSPHPHAGERPRWWPKEREWPGPTPPGHVTPGVHRVTLWARAEGGVARIARAAVRRTTLETQPGTNRVHLR